jgi:hypothetical protein
MAGIRREDLVEIRQRTLQSPGTLFFHRSAEQIFAVHFRHSRDLHIEAPII